MTVCSAVEPMGFAFPAWVPEPVRSYLAHTEGGQAIRALARDRGCHPSTVMRQVRRTEQRRDDPLVDRALVTLSRIMCSPEAHQEMPCSDAQTQASVVQTVPDERLFARESQRVLLRLAEPGAVLAVADGMGKAVVVREGAVGTSQRTAVVATAIAEAMALQDWIALQGTGRIARYRITPAGMARLSPQGVPGLAEAPAALLGTPGRARVRYGAAEGPLVGLARRRGQDGRPFLTHQLASAGERLREDYELARMAPGGASEPETLLRESLSAPARRPGARTGPEAARARLRAALYELGPGLADVALRCCCLLDGLEEAERALGWSARSGKIVLRIALQRLARHYEDTQGGAGPLIG